MKKKVCCLLLGISILCLPAQEVFAAPADPATLAEEKKEEKPKPHEKKLPHEKLPHEKLPHEKLPHEKLPHEKPKPHEHAKVPGPLGAEKPVPPADGEKPALPHEKNETEPELPVEDATEVGAPKPTETPKPTAVPKEDVVTDNPQKNPTEEEKDDTEKDSSLRQQVVEYALQFVGNPYKYGGTSLTNGTDCSGFTQAVYAKFGYDLSRSSKGQAADTEYTEVKVKESELLPGDLIFYANGSGVVYHVAMYIGDGKVVHAANAKKGIVVSDYSYYDMKPYIARRIIE